MMRLPKIAVVLPCYKVKRHLSAVVSSIGPEVCAIYVVDDCCPEDSGLHIEATVKDPRVRVLHHSENRGVGGATMTGYRQALEDGQEIVVKLDGDGQMDPALIPHIVAPIVAGTADYTKGNRFYDISGLSSMPWIRLVGNSILSFVNKVSSGYWNVMDPTNGYTAIHGEVLRLLPFEKIDNRYFFESDLLFRLGTIRAVVVDVPMRARYASEVSNLSITKTALSFPLKYFICFLKRVAYNYILRDFNAATVEFGLGTSLILFGTSFGLFHWIRADAARVFASSGTVMLASLPIILGTQLLVSALSQDISSVPQRPIHLSPLPKTLRKRQG